MAQYILWSTKVDLATSGAYDEVYPPESVGEKSLRSSGTSPGAAKIREWAFDVARATDEQRSVLNARPIRCADVERIRSYAN